MITRAKEILAAAKDKMSHAVTHLDEEGVFSSLALHLCVERVILDKRSYLIGYHIFKREDGRDCGGVSTPGHGQGEGPARYEFRDSGTK